MLFSLGKTTPLGWTIMMFTLSAGNNCIRLKKNLFWSPTKTINFFRCLLLIDVKSVRNIRYDFFVLRVMAFNQQILPFFADSQFTVNIHWSCLYCLFMLSLIFIMACDLFEWKRICAFFFIVCLYRYCSSRYNYQLSTWNYSHAFIINTKKIRNFVDNKNFTCYHCVLQWNLVKKRTLNELESCVHQTLNQVPI